MVVYEKMSNAQLAEYIREYITDEGREVILTATDSDLFAEVAKRLNQLTEPPQHPAPGARG